MGLNIKYMPVNTFQEIFLDKDTGCNLAGGIVKFYQDESRITAKEVFKLSGTAPNYTYTSIGTEVTLSGIGTFDDGLGNDITVYLYPYDSDGNLQLYYATVESSGAVGQITREAFPNLSEDEEVDEELNNYIPNGQFFLHKDILDNVIDNYEAGEISEPVTDVAQGGWTYERNAESTAKDFVLFERFGSYVANPTRSPRYAVNVKNETIGSGTTFKELRITFNDVNKFASSTKFYTFSFSGKSNTGSASNIVVKRIKNYGSGGTAEDKETLQTISLSTSYDTYDVPFQFGDNEGDTIGPNDDDFVALAISFPIANVFDDSFTNMILTDDDVQVTEYPDITDEEYKRDALAGLIPVPDYDGQNNGLPLILGQQGYEYRSGEVGNYVMKSTEDLDINEFGCEGQKIFTDDWSAQGIPYSRLYKFWSKNSPVGLSIYGIGPNGIEVIHPTLVKDQEYLDGVEELILDFSTGWQSFTAGITGRMTDIAIQVEIPGHQLDIKIRAGAGPGGTILSSQTIEPIKGWQTIHLATPVNVIATTVYNIELHAGVFPVYIFGSKTGGTYVGGDWSGVAGSDANFKTFVDPTSSDTLRLETPTAGAVTPAADGAAPTGFTFTPVAPSPYQVDITFLAGASVPASAYFTYHTPDSVKFIAWYTVDGVGTQPVESANYYHQIDILTTDTAVSVGNSTAKKINAFSYKIPNWKGITMRVQDQGAGTDPNAGTRTDRGDGTTGDNVGTIEQGTLTDGTGAIEARMPNRYIRMAVKF